MEILAFFFHSNQNERKIHEPFSQSHTRPFPFSRALTENPAPVGADSIRTGFFLQM